MEHPPVYNGKEPYIFVSYAHRDSDAVIPIIDQLTRWGFRVWYDAGIEAGTEWPEYIASHLEASQVVIAFISEASIASPHCRQEITFAETKRKDILSIYLDNAKLPAGLEMQLGNNQSMFFQRAESFDAFIRQLIIAELLRPCCTTPERLPSPKAQPAGTRYTPPQPKGQPHTPAPAPQKQRSGFSTVLIVLLIIAALVCGFLLIRSCSGSGSGSGNTNSPAEKYEKAISLIQSGNYHEAYTILQELGDYEDSQMQMAQIREKALIQRISSAKNGEIVVWGSYEQNNDTSDGAEPIEWVVLHSKDGLTLLLSKYGLDSMPYHEEAREITWKKCDLRAWLNDEFYYEAFSNAEQRYIFETTVVTEGSEDTRDKVFLLSADEAELYASLFPTLEATAYAIHQGASDITPDFWLRSPWHAYGSLIMDWANVYSYDKYLTMDKVNEEGNAIFPCIWIDSRDQSDLESAYNDALALFQTGQYKRALTAFQAMGDYKDSADYVKRLPELITMQPFMEAAIGDEVTLGDHDFIVLDKQADRVLIVSKYALGEKDYHSYSMANPSWEESTLRQWLNNDFLNGQLGASEEEKALILVTALTSDAAGEEVPSDDLVYDRIFLLSYSEVLQYFPTENARLLYTENNSGTPVMWWLRTKATGGGSRAMYVDSFGVISTEGEYVFQLSPEQQIRPAMWIRIEDPTATPTE